MVNLDDEDLRRKLESLGATTQVVPVMAYQVMASDRA